MDCKHIDDGLREIVELATDARTCLRTGDTGKTFVSYVEAIRKIAVSVLEQVDELRHPLLRE